MEAPKKQLYPPIEPYHSFNLNVDSIHSLYVEESGNPSGKPVIVLHGGPGGSAEPWYRQFFNPDKYRIIMFDQRGAGKSTPHASLIDNDTWHLVDDIEKIREECKVNGKWVVFGGSWGSTLALSYAETYPNRVEALILRGIFLCRRKELLWFYQEGASFLFPEAFSDYVSHIPETERGDIMSAYYRRLTLENDEKTRLECARAWSLWEMTTSRLYVDPNNLKKANDDDKFALSFARIECHYFVHGAFMKKDGQLLLDAHKLSEIPGTIVQGRYDVVCPATSAFELSLQWPKAELNIVPDAGHSMKEPGIMSLLLDACDKYSE